MYDVPRGLTAIATYRSATLIYNPCAGRLRGKRIALIEDLVRTLSDAGHGVTAVPTTAPGHAGVVAREAAAAGADLILGVGGDGTLNDIVNGLVHTEVPILMLPAGTANVLTRELGLGTDPMRVATTVGSLVPERVGVGLLHASDAPPRYFMLMAGAGFDGHIVYNLNLPLKAQLGQLAYWVGAMKEIPRRLDELEVEIDGRTQRCTFALASRVRNYAGWMSIAPCASLRDTDFEVILFEGTSPLFDYVRHFATVMTGKMENARGVTLTRARVVSFNSVGAGPTYFQIDGEYAGQSPGRAEFIPDAITILVPPGCFA